MAFPKPVQACWVLIRRNPSFGLRLPAASSNHAVLVLVLTLEQFELLTDWLLSAQHQKVREAAYQ